MPKSRKPSRSGCTDGRASNRPPAHNQIKPGEIRNPYGRAGKPRNVEPFSVDELVLKEAGRIVSREGDESIDVTRRLIQEEHRDALVNKNAAVRARCLDRISAASERVERHDQETLAWIIERQGELREAFHAAKRYRREPPDVAHPDHVRITGNDVSFHGPIDKPSRENWELIKAAIRVAACSHEIVRNEFRKNPSAQVREHLRKVEAQRRKLMRAVPNGWNWREDIYCRDSQFEFTTDLIQRLKEIGYVRPIED
jgi:hypothetical protein